MINYAPNIVRYLDQMRKQYDFKIKGSKGIRRIKKQTDWIDFLIRNSDICIGVILYTPSLSNYSPLIGICLGTHANAKTVT
jgi:hypothetical protein